MPPAVSHLVGVGRTYILNRLINLRLGISTVIL